jgi:RhtB (resistance to homoserine/threonine) family protein
MEIIFLITSVALVHFLAVVSPGPDLMVVMKNSLVYSRKTGIFTSVGLSLGMFVHIIYSASGLAAIISQSILVFSVLKYLGAAYLMYIGWKSFFSKSQGVEINAKKKMQDLSVYQAIKIGFLTNLLNPKATLYFLGLFTLVLSPEISLGTLALLSAVMIGVAILWFSAVSLFLTVPKIRCVFEKIQNVLNKVFGVILIAFGIKVAISQK